LFKGFYKSKGLLFVVSAPSGAGKTTLCYRLSRELPDLAFSVSHTTRKPRSGEEEGRDYYFVSAESFSEMVDAGAFVEWAEVHGNRYGTSRAELNRLLSLGKDVILDIDTQGAMQIKSSGMRGTFVFILPPSMHVLEQRLKDRDTDDEEVIRRRLENAVGEIKLYNEYDYVVVNDELDEALDKLKMIVKVTSERSWNVDDTLLKTAFGI
jgi:guanylate kinase